MNNPLKISIIIPTYNRPDDLKNCLSSILKQTVRPYEIIVIDDGDLRAPPLRKTYEEKGIGYVYRRKNTPGLTASRNLGLSLSKGDIIFFLDDDVILFPNYLEEIMKVYDTYHDPNLAGVGGIIENVRLKWRIYDAFFLISGIREGEVLRSGFTTNYGTGFPPKRVMKVDFLMGGVSSYRREIFSEFLFSEEYRGYGKGEDKDFSYRVSRKYLLLINPSARLYHYESPQMRYDKARNAQEFIFVRYKFFKDYLYKHKRDWLFFCWASVGYFLRRMTIMVFTFDIKEAGRIKGILKGFRDILVHMKSR